MASFADLKASRAGKRRPLVNPATPSSTASNGHGTSSPLDDTSSTPDLEDSEGPKSSMEYNEEERVTPSMADVGAQSPNSVPVKDLPFYPDFPAGRLDVRTSKIAGRGMYIAEGSSARAGQSLIKTAPVSAVLSTSCLTSRCSTCWLDERELQIKGGTMQAGQPGQGGVTAGGPTKEALKRCASCKVVRYCSQACQAAGWAAHAPECRAFKRLRRVSKLHKKRKAAASAEEKADNGWDVAKGDEEHHSELEDGSWIPGEDVRALGRLCWARRKAKETGPEEEGKYWQSINALQSHRQSLTTSQREPFAKLALKLNQYLASEIPLTGGQKDEELTPVDMGWYGFSSVGEVLDLCTAFASNSFTLSSPSLDPIGLAVSPLTALFNHSCEPNAVVVFPAGGDANSGKGMEVNAIRGIRAGEEVLTSYVDVASPYHIRHKELQDRYYFDCACPVCMGYKAGKVDPRWALKHFQCGGITHMPDLALNGSQSVRCQACGYHFDVAVERLASLIEFAEGLIKEDSRGSMSNYSASRVPSTVQSLSEFLPPSSHPLQPLLRINSLLASRPIPTAPDQPPSEHVLDLFAAIESQSLAWRGMKDVYPAGHPSIGVALTELGKLLNLDATVGAVASNGNAKGNEVQKRLQLPVQASERLGLARETLIMALKELRIGFGRSGGLVGKEVEAIVEGLSMEMRVQGLLRQS